MSARRHSLLQVMLLVLLSQSFGCDRQEPKSSIPEVASRLEQIDEESRAAILAAKDDLFQRLSGRLMAVLGDQGPGGAIRVCSQEAPGLAQSVSKERGLRIGRTSTRLRNPSNVPPKWAVSILEEAPSEPTFLALDGGQIGALLPIKLQAMCLMCHGPKESMLEEVRSELAKRYPRDQATEYREGDVRGWFWVELPAKG